MEKWFLVKKLDNAYRGLIGGVERGDVASHINVDEMGREMFNRNFQNYPTGSMIEVLVDIKDSGRRFVKRVSLYDGTRIYELLPTTEEDTKPKMKKKSEVKSKILANDPLHGFYVSPEARLNFNTALKMLKAHPERAVKVLIVGPSGYGKTSLPRLVSQLTGMDFMRMNCATIRDPEEWFGYREAREGSTIFIASEFARRFTKGNLVVVLDEFNRLEPWLHNTLFPLLDDDGFTTVHDQEFRIGQGVLAVATINTGYKYTGTFELDEALVNRFDFVLEVGILPHDEEVKVLRLRSRITAQQAEEMVKLSTSLRQSGVVCSIRTTLLMARMIDHGMTIREAFDSAVIRRIPQDSNGSSVRKQVVDLINSRLGSLEQRSLAYDIFSGNDDTESLPKDDAVAKVVLSSIGNDVGFVTLMTIIRELPLVGGEISMKKLRELAEEVRSGSIISLMLNATISDDNFEELKQRFNATGVSCTYGDIR